MRAEGLFLNGVYEEVLAQIVKVQDVLPHQILYLQPYAGGAIARLRDDPPTPQAPMLLLASTTKDLGIVQYAGEVVGWDDKRVCQATFLSPVQRQSSFPIVLAAVSRPDDD
jgi:hypothetical protein